MESQEGDEIFRARPHRSWGLLTLLYKGYRIPFPEVKRPGRGVNHSPPPSAEVKERVEVYLWFPSEPSWFVLGRTLPSISQISHYSQPVFGSTVLSPQILTEEPLYMCLEPTYGLQTPHTGPYSPEILRTGHLFPSRGTFKSRTLSNCV
jgi:hypothetical protein